MSDFTINISPSNEVLKQIKTWLKNEEDEFNEGFYCNWPIIEKRFKKGELISIQNGNEPIGFAIWSINNELVLIDIFEIHPHFRNAGVGKCLFDNCLKFFKERECKLVELECEPRESESFWGKQGFIKFPDRGYGESDLRLFMPTIPSQELSVNEDENEKLEMWDKEPGKVKGSKPSWTWELKFKKQSNKLIKPIIYPCNDSWQLRWTKNGKIISEDKVKNFSKGEICRDRFLIVTRLAL